MNFAVRILPPISSNSPSEVENPKLVVFHTDYFCKLLITYHLDIKKIHARFMYIH